MNVSTNSIRAVHPVTDIEVDNDSCILGVLLDVLQLHHLTLFVPARYLADTVVVLAMTGTEVCNELVEPLATTDCQVVYDIPESELRYNPCRTVLPMKEETLEQLSTSGLLVS